MPTKKLTINEAQTNLSKHIADLKDGDRIILCCGDEPVAEMLPLTVRSDELRPVGLGKGLAEVPDSFFDPLPDDILHDFDIASKWATSPGDPTRGSPSGSEDTASVPASSCSSRP